MVEDVETGRRKMQGCHLAFLKAKSAKFGLF